MKLYKRYKVFIHENAFENAVYKMAPILLMGFNALKVRMHRQGLVTENQSTHSVLRLSIWHSNIHILLSDAISTCIFNS